jgi:hypothetical protein
VLSELTSPNLATYSPVYTEVRNDLDSILDFVMDENVDLTKSARAEPHLVDIAVLQHAGLGHRILAGKAEIDGDDVGALPMNAVVGLRILECSLVLLSRRATDPLCRDVRACRLYQ